MKKWICSVCGYSVEAEVPPDVCPVCGADKSLFEAVELSSGASSPDQENIRQDSPAEDALPDSSDFKAKAIKIGESMIMKHHLHPIFVHIPNGVVPVSFAFIFISLISGGLPSLEKAAFFNLIFVLLSMPLVALTGFVSWKKKYSSAMTSVFKTKIVCSLVLTSCVFVSVIWRLFDDAAGSSWIYLILNAIILASAGLAGFMGGKLVFNK